MIDNKSDAVRNQRQGPGPNRRTWLITSLVAAATLALFGGLWAASAVPQQRADRDQFRVRDADQPARPEDQRDAHPGTADDQARPDAVDRHPQDPTSIQDPTNAQDPTGVAAIPAAPGWEPDVQQWFKDQEQLQVDLNNTLVIVARQTGSSPEAITACRRLADVTFRLQSIQHSPVVKLDAPAGAGIEQFSQAAQACLSGDFPTMGRQLTDGMERRASAQNDIDEILEGEE